MLLICRGVPANIYSTIKARTQCKFSCNVACNKTFSGVSHTAFCCTQCRKSRELDSTSATVAHNTERKVAMGSSLKSFLDAGGSHQVAQMEHRQTTQLKLNRQAHPHPPSPPPPDGMLISISGLPPAWRPGLQPTTSKSLMFNVPEAL